MSAPAADGAGASCIASGRSGWRRFGKRSLSGAIVVGLVACGLFLLSLYGLPRQQREASGWVDHTLEVLQRTAVLQVNLFMAVAEERGFVIDRSAERQARFDAACVRGNNDLAALRALTTDNPVQQRALDRLALLIQGRLAVQRAIMQQAGTGDLEGAMRSVRAHRDRALTTQLLAVVQGMEAEERRLLAERREAASVATRQTVLALIGCFMLVAASFLLAVALLLRRRRERGQAQRERTQAERERTHAAELRESYAQLEILNGVGASFAAELHHERLVETVVEAAMRLTGAAYAALFECVTPECGGNDGDASDSGKPDSVKPGGGGTETWRLASLAGAPREAFTRFGLPRATGLFGPTFRAEGIVRADDVLADPRYGSHGGLPPGHLPIRSYLSMPVVSHTGAKLGGLLFGHPEPGRFGAREERLVVGLAGQVAIALDNARLFCAVQQEQSRFRAAVQAVDGVLWTNDAAGHMVGEQPGWAALTGQRFEEYQGDGWAAAIHPDDVQPTMDAWNEALAGGHSFAFEHRLRRWDGTWRTFAIRAMPVLEPDGNGPDGGVKVREWVGVHTDLTEQREAEAANARLAIIVTSADDAIMSFAPDDGRILTWNGGAERLFGYTEAEAVGELAGLLVGPERPDGGEPTGVFAWALAGRPVVAHATVRVAKGGEHIPVTVTATRMLAPDGRVMGVSAIFQDLRPRLRVEAALREANEALERRVAERTAELERLARHLARARDEAEAASRAKSRFLAGMSHELRTPLNGILGYAELLRREGGLSAGQSVRVDAMLGAGQHLLEMINRVLDLSEIEAGRVELRAAEIDPCEVARACLDLVRPAAEAKGLVLHLDVAPGTPSTLTAESVRVRQVLVNLLGNAVKFTARGSVSLRLRPATDGAALRVEVADTGPGIPAERRHRLFQEFDRLGAAEADARIEGAGLGLALSAQLAAVMGGRLGHEDNPGGGCVFWLELPLSAGDTDAAAAKPVAVPGAIPGAVLGAIPGAVLGAPGPAPLALAPSEPQVPLRVLLVDDVAMNRDIAGSFLRAAGHAVILAEGGRAAVEAASAAEFDVVLMDVRMPEVDGLEATRRIRALAGPRGRVPIVALTAQAFAEQVAECRQAGMDDHLAKPFPPDALLAAVARAAAAARARSGSDDAAGFGDVRATEPAAAAPGSELPVLDEAAFEHTAAFLTPAAIAAYLERLAASGEALLLGLQAPGALVSARTDLAEAAHALAGSAGMFGFERLATVARRFERAVQSGAADAPALAGGLGTAIEASVGTMRSRGPALCPAG